MKESRVLSAPAAKDTATFRWGRDWVIHWRAFGNNHVWNRGHHR
jgi:hypothetical protein